jgi:hypothetical protein
MRFSAIPSESFMNSEETRSVKEKFRTNFYQEYFHIRKVLEKLSEN